MLANIQVSWLDPNKVGGAPPGWTLTSSGCLRCPGASPCPAFHGNAHAWHGAVAPQVREVVLVGSRQRIVFDDMLARSTPVAIHQKA